MEIPTKNVQSLYEATENYIQELRRDNDEKNSVGDNQEDVEEENEE